MRKWIKRNREKIDKELRGYKPRSFFSPAIYSRNRVIEPVILEYVHGKLIDIGCGDMPYRELILNKVTQYDTLDLEKRVPEVKFVSDIQHMDDIRDQSYDSAVCFEVLEHVPNPFQAISEVCRILKKNGTLILSVPHLSRLHEEPYDFFRYTKYGLRYLLENSGFKILTIIPAGGMFSFLGHQFATIFVCLFWHIPVIKEIVFFINKWFCVLPCYWLDRIMDKQKIFALNYVCIVRKK